MLGRLAWFLGVALASASSLPAQVVTYSGQVFDEFGDLGTPGAYVIAGTFREGFDPYDYNCVYGDEACNQVGGEINGERVPAFEAAVFEENFFPIGEGVLTDAGGVFSGSGMTDAAVGTPIWLFAFDSEGAGSSDAFFQILATSVSAPWQVLPGLTQINAREADTAVMGFPRGDGIAFSVIPFPEPSAGLLVLLTSLTATVGRRG